jgi:hypothetical protein
LAVVEAESEKKQRNIVINITTLKIIETIYSDYSML